MSHPILVMTAAERRYRIDRILCDVEALQLVLLRRLAALEELTTPGDPLALEIRRFVDLICE
jgi:hypothetical protein